MSSRAGVLTRDGVWTADEWRVHRAQADISTDVRDSGAAGDAVDPSVGTERALLPLALYLAQPHSVAHGVWLAPTDDPMELQPYLQSVPMIAVQFPAFTDGRGYSIASTLRNRLHYRADLRAIGDILIDRVFFLRRVGFSSFALRADQDRAAAVKALHTFSDAYQAAADQPLPAFRRHARPRAESATNT